MSAPGAKPDKVARSQRPLHAHERRKLNIFLVRSLRVDQGPEVDHVRSTLKWHFPLRYRSTRPCPMCSFTFWFSVSSLESIRLLLRLYLRKDFFSARCALDLHVSSLSLFFFLRVARASRASAWIRHWSFGYQNWRKGSFLKVGNTLGPLRSWCHVPRASKSLWSFRNTCVRQRSYRHRLPTDTSLLGSPRSFSNNLALWKQKSALWREGVSSRKDFRWYDAFLPGRWRENQEKSAWLDAADYADLRSCSAGPSR